MIAKQCVILGGGLSIARDGIPLGLWNKIKDKFVIGLNFVYKLPFDFTFICYVDSVSFYEKYFNELKNLPLIIGNYNSNIEKTKHNNTILLKHTNKYNRDIKDGVYQPFLCGVWALTIAIYLLDIGEIFLLGYDFGALPPNSDSKNKIITLLNQQVEVEEVINIKENNRNLIIQNGKTYRIISHFYQKEINHRGIGRCSFYTKAKADELFNVYKNESLCKIYNVSPQSKINIFEKIDYNQFFNKLSKETYNQEELRQQIRKKLCIS
jgi:hypothetical protein